MKKLALIGLFLVIITTLVVSRVLYLDSGIHFSEPDEWSYDIASKSLSNEIIPKVAGRPLLEQSPVFEYLAHWINSVVKDTEYPKTFLATRTISVISSIVLALVIFLYTRRKENPTVAWYSLIFFTLTPIVLFYSKMGLREMLLILCLFSFYLCYEKFMYTKSKVKWAVLAGLTLGISVLIKTTALIFFLIPFFYLVLSFFDSVNIKSTQFNQFWFKLKLSSKWRPRSFYNFIVVFVSGLVVVGSFLPYYFAYPAFFVDRFYLTFFSHNSEGTLQKIRTIIYYLNHLDTWLSIPLLSLSIVGVVLLIFGKKSKWFLSLVFSALICLFLLGNEPRGRYFVLLSPFLVIYASLGLDFLIQKINRTHNSNIYKFILPLIVFAGIIPSTAVAFKGGQHSVFEQMSEYLRSNNHSELIYSSFWPPIVQYATGIPTARLTSVVPDLTRDYNELPKFSPYMTVVAEDYLQNNNTYIIIHSPTDPDELSVRKESIENITSGRTPTKIFTDGKPNFPEKLNNFELKVYKFDKPQ